MMERLRTLLRRRFVQDTLVLQIGRVGTTLLTLLSSLLVARLLGTEAYGTWALIQSLLAITLALNLTGISAALSTRLPLAIGAGQTDTIRDGLAIYVQVSALWGIGLVALLMVIGPALGRQLYDDDQIGVLAAILALTVLPDALYNLVITALQSQRAMRSLAVLQNINQAVLLLATLAALLISPTPLGMVLSRVVYSVLTLVIAVGFYQRYRVSFTVPYPPIMTVLRRALRVSPGPYLGFGFLNAVDKNIASLYTEIPLQLVGIFAGRAAAGYLELGFKALTIANTFTSAVFDTMQVVIPQTVGRRDFAALRQNFTRVLVVLGVGGSVFYALFALGTPLLIPLLFDSSWQPAVPAVATLAIYGVVTTVGGIFGPLYRTLNLMREAIGVKLIALASILIPGWLTMQQIGRIHALWTLPVATLPDVPSVLQAGAISGAWMVNGLLTVSVVLTALFCLRALRRMTVTPTLAE
jgi:O-antigen/teichoic acid export membrane protein